MKFFASIFWILFCAGIFCGCTALQKPAPAKSATAIPAEKLQMRNNSVSLLYDLLGNEKNVSKVLIIKGSREELHSLIKAISATAGIATKQLDQLAEKDATLNLRALELPAGEKATRDAISKTKEKELLFSSGENFEFTLLLTQADALSYGWHLAKIAAENSTQPEQVQEFDSVSEAMQGLYKQVVALMRSPPPAK
ncbi:MAG TPA: hypothetical protein VHX90_03140 [Verrucomicrobiae bacterium]|jgi:hypothetical protein|nr:hypothetical protein [Verrucomicrobiae bacterium]